MPSKRAIRVRTFRALQSAMEAEFPVCAVLEEDIPIGQAFTIPERHTIMTTNAGLVKQGDGSLLFQGTLEAHHGQVFFGFEPGDITGGFGAGVVRPVWWGATAKENPPNAETEGTDHIGINAAIRTANGAHGHLVELDAGYYHIGGPLDLAGTNSRVIGAGAHRTELWSCSNWTAEWADDAVFGAASHGAMVWLGSTAPAAGNSMNTGVEGVYLNCYYAALANLTKRVSAVSTRGWIEEHTVIRNVTASYFSGYGFGFMSSGSPAIVVNGLSIESFWLTQPVSATAIPIALGRHCSNASVFGGTIDCRVNNPPPVFNGAPWPLVMTAVLTDARNVSLENLHIEGVRFGILVREFDQGSVCTIRNVNVFAGHDVGMTNTLTGFTLDLLAPNGDYFNWSTAVAVYGETVLSPTGVQSGAAIAHKPRVIVENVRAESVKYLLRDPAMGVDVLNWNNGQISVYTGALTSYVRSNAWSPANNTWYWNVSPFAYGSFPADGKTYRTIIP